MDISGFVWTGRPASESVGGAVPERGLFLETAFGGCILAANSREQWMPSPVQPLRMCKKSLEGCTAALQPTCCSGSTIFFSSAGHWTWSKWDFSAFLQEENNQILKDLSVKSLGISKSTTYKGKCLNLENFHDQWKGSLLCVTLWILCTVSLRTFFSGGSSRVTQVL